MLWHNVRRGGFGLARLHVFIALSVLNHVYICNGEIPRCVVDKVVAACKRCDAQYGSHLASVTANFTNDPRPSPLEVARLHCRDMSSISGCYTDCVQGCDFQYVTDVARLANASIDLCNDASCEAYVIPGCYALYGAEIFNGYNFSTSGCDPNNHTMSPRISQCMDMYAQQQNCSGMCTPGQRAQKSVKFLQEVACKIPATSVVCNAEVQACISQTFGLVGDKFISGSAFAGRSSNVTCSYGRAFSACLANTLNDTAALGAPPCRSYTSEIEQLIALNDAVYKPFCDHSSQSFESVCALPSKTAQKSCKKQRR